MARLRHAAKLKVGPAARPGPLQRLDPLQELDPLQRYDLLQVLVQFALISDRLAKVQSHVCCEEIFHAEPLCLDMRRAQAGFHNSTDSFRMQALDFTHTHTKCKATMAAAKLTYTSICHCQMNWPTWCGKRPMMPGADCLTSC